MSSPPRGLVHKTRVKPATQLTEIRRFNPLDAPLRVKRFILSGDKPDSITILQHLDYFKKVYMRDPYVRYVTLGIMTDLVNNDLVNQVAKAVCFVKERMTYVRDPDGAELIHSPTRLLKQIMKIGVAHGDCDDHALLLNSMLGSIGIETRFVGVMTGNSTKYNHVICSVNINGEWLDVDPCSKFSTQPNYEKQLII